MKPERCQAITKRGKPCGATVVADGLCAWHAPSWEARRRQWSAKGGQARSNASRARKALAGDIRDLADVKARLMVALVKVEEAELEPGAANAMANLARAIVAVAGVADFESSLVEMRQQIAELSARRGA